MSATLVERYAAGHGAWQAVANRMVHAVKQMQRWQKRRRDRQHLKQLPDYLLRDIGISRMEIDVATALDDRAALTRSV